MKKKIICILIILLIIVMLITIYLLKNLARVESEVEEEGNNEYNGIGGEIIDSTFIKDNSKTSLNLLLKIMNKNQQYYYIKEIYKYDKDDILLYFIYTIKEHSNKFFVVYVDENNNTYLVEEISEGEYENIKQQKIDNRFLQAKIIEKNDDNEYVYELMTDKRLILLYYDIIKNLFQYEPETLYEILDDEYKQKKFNNNIENFYEYVEINKDRFLNMEISKYAKYSYDEYVQYIILDTNDNYYIINDYLLTGEYKVFLDSYVIDQPETIEKYNKYTNEEKAGYNINKFIQAINEKDYNYAYNCLANSFKANYFKTINEFREYIKNNFYNNNHVEFTKVNKEGNYYIHTLNIQNANNTTESFQKNFIVNLLDDMNFEMSFNI